jgi:hypothetical protein
MVFNATFHTISVIDLIKITGLVWIKIYKTLNQFLEYLKRYNDLIFKNKMMLHHAYKYIFPFHKCCIILTFLDYNTPNLEVSDFLYSNEKYSANLLCIDEFMFLPYNPKLKWK